MQYELFYLIGASHETEMPEIKKEAESIVEKAGGKFLEKETLDKRRLSYKIKHENFGIYLCRRFELEDITTLPEIIKNLNLNTRILRFLISKAAELPELKSKEERIAEAAKREKSKEHKEVRVGASQETAKADEIKTENKAEEKVKTAKKNEDIDKKLEEILNI